MSDLIDRAKLTIPELCNSVAHIRPSEATLHPAVQVASEAATEKAIRVTLAEVEATVVKAMNSSGSQRSVTDQLRHCTAAGGADLISIKIRAEQGRDVTEPLDRLTAWIKLVDVQTVRIENALADFARLQAEVGEGE